MARFLSQHHSSVASCDRRGGHSHSVSRCACQSVTSCETPRPDVAVLVDATGRKGVGLPAGARILVPHGAGSTRTLASTALCPRCLHERRARPLGTDPTYGSNGSPTKAPTARRVSARSDSGGRVSGRTEQSVTEEGSVELRPATCRLRIAASSGRRLTPVLAMSRSTCFSTVRAEMNRRLAISGFDRRSPTSRRTSISRSVTPWRRSSGGTSASLRPLGGRLLPRFATVNDSCC